MSTFWEDSQRTKAAVLDFEGDGWEECKTITFPLADDRLDTVGVV